MGLPERRKRTKNLIEDHFQSDLKFLPVFLDTNFLMAMGALSNFNLSYEIDRVIPQSYRLIILKPIYDELLKLSTEGSPKVKLQSRLALRFIENYEIFSTRYHHKNADFVLLTYAEKYHGIIATNDRQLRNLARKKKIKTMYIRERRYLEIG